MFPHTLIAFIQTERLFKVTCKSEVLPAVREIPNHTYTHGSEQGNRLFAQVSDRYMNFRPDCLAFKSHRAQCNVLLFSSKKELHLIYLFILLLKSWCDFIPICRGLWCSLTLRTEWKEHPVWYDVFTSRTRKIIHVHKTLWLQWAVFKTN